MEDQGVPEDREDVDLAGRLRAEAGEDRHRRAEADGEAEEEVREGRRHRREEAAADRDSAVCRSCFSWDLAFPPQEKS